MTHRLTRGLFAALLLPALIATAGCGVIDDMTGGSPSTTPESYPATVKGPGAPMSKQSCAKYKDPDKTPLECQKSVKGTARLFVTSGSTSYGTDENVPIDQFSATCTKTTTTVTGPDDLKLVFTRDARKVEVYHGAESLGSYDDPFLRWVTHVAVMTAGTSKLGDGQISVSIYVVCGQPMTKTPTPAAGA